MEQIFTIEIYANEVGFSQPVDSPFYRTQLYTWEEESLGTHWKRYGSRIDGLYLAPDRQFWIVFQCKIAHDNWGCNCFWPGTPTGWGDGQQGYFRGKNYGLPSSWVPCSTFFGAGNPLETSFQLYGQWMGINEEVGLITNQRIQTSLLKGPLQIILGGSNKIFDITGRQIHTLNPAPGIYFVEVDGEIIHKIIKIR